MAKTTTTAPSPLSGTAQGLYTDLERLFGDRFDQFGQQLKDELRKASGAGAALGGAAGAAALGTMLGGLAFVHLVHKVTGLPLWLCYAGGSALACSLGGALYAEGVEKAADLDLIPHQAKEAVREGVADVAREPAAAAMR